MTIKRSTQWVLDGALTGLAIVACLAMGKDLNVDMLNYHLYVAHAFWTGTYTESFMGTGLQSFLNPVGYVPFYLMVKHQWHSVIVAIILCIPSAIGILSIQRLSYEFLFRDKEQRLTLSIFAAILGGVSPLFLATLGTSFLDPWQASLVIVSLYLTAKGLELAQARRGRLLIFLGACLLGASAGLKLTGLYLCIASLAALAVLPRPWKQRAQDWLAGLAGMSAGFILTAGYWTAHLLFKYGNPVFPFANGLFKSPDFANVSIGLDRFTADSWTDILSLPFRMAQIKSGVYAEILVPDIRFACLLILVVLITIRLLPSYSRAIALTRPMSVGDKSASRYLIAFFCTGYVAWILSSGNGRYYLAIVMLVGPLLVLACSALLKKPVALIGTLTAILLAQVVHGGAAGYRRWDSTAWTPKWIEADIRHALADQPYRYLMVGPENDSTVVPYLHPDSLYLTLIGKVPLSPNKPGATRVREFIDRSTPPLRVLVRESEVRGSPLYESGKPDEVTLGMANDDLAAWGLSVSPENCAYVGITLGKETGRSPESGNAPAQLWPRNYSFLSCPILRGTKATNEFFQTQRKLELLGESLSRSCKLLFPEPGSFPVRLGELWAMRFAGTDIVVTSDGATARYSRYPFGPFQVPLGQVDAWLHGSPKIDCARLPRR
jgi:hypothetical protein